ncbi:unnamed protein product, partial [Cyprideis torosa]
VGGRQPVRGGEGTVREDPVHRPEQRRGQGIIPVPLGRRRASSAGPTRARTRGLVASGLQWSSRTGTSNSRKQGQGSNSPFRPLLRPHCPPTPSPLTLAHPTQNATVPV